MSYVPIKEQCWFARCRRKAEYNTIVNGKAVKICLKHYNIEGKPTKEERTRRL
jgi:hypothetical protein